MYIHSPVSPFVGVLSLHALPRRSGNRLDRRRAGFPRWTAALPGGGVAEAQALQRATLSVTKISYSSGYPL